MRTKRFTLLLVLALVITSAAFTCSHKAATTSRGVAASLMALQDSEIALHNAGKVTDSEHQTLQKGFLLLAQTGIQVNKCIGQGGAGGCVDPAIAVLDTFIASDVVGIKNPDSRAAITLAAKTLESSLVILKGAL